MCTYGTPEEAKEISRAESTFKRYIYYTYNILYIIYIIYQRLFNFCCYIGYSYNPFNIIYN